MVINRAFSAAAQRVSPQLIYKILVNCFDYSIAHSCPLFNNNIAVIFHKYSLISGKLAYKN